MCEAAATSRCYMAMPDCGLRYWAESGRWWAKPTRRINPFGYCSPGPVLYRCFDSTNTLVYLGKTVDLGRRLRGHERDNGKMLPDEQWLPLVAYILIQRYRSKAKLNRAEMDAIATEHPIFNRVGRRPRSA